MMTSNESGIRPSRSFADLASLAILAYGDERASANHTVLTQTAAAIEAVERYPLARDIIPATAVPDLQLQARSPAPGMERRA